MKKIQITESELIKVIKKILKEQQNNRREQLKDYILDCFNFEDYEVPENPFKEGFNLFLETQEHDIRRYGMKEAFAQYIMGLPNWINLPYYHDEIRDLLYALGYDEVKDNDMDEMQIQKLFYSEIFNIFMENK